MECTQKLHIPTPVYNSVPTGPPHKRIFTATVSVNGKIYDSPPSSSFSKLRDAEHAAARVALQELYKEERYAEAVLDTEFCITLLHEQLKKLDLPDPSYSWEKSGETSSKYIYTVEIAGIPYVGKGAKSKKAAEINAARKALLEIQRQHCKPTTEVVVDAHSGMKREREAEQPAGGQKDEMNKRRNTENASAIDLKDEQSHLQQEMCVNDGQETKAGEGLSYQETAQKSEAEEMVHRTEEEAAKESRDEVVPALEEIDGQLTKPVAGLNSQETAQKREGEEMIHRTDEQAKQSSDEVVPALEKVIPKM